jgi:hypothetical protein
MVFLAIGWSGAVCAQSGSTASATNKQFEFRARPFCASQWRAARAVWRDPLAPSFRDGQGHSGSFGDDVLQYSLEELRQKISRRESSVDFRDPINAYLTCLYRYRARELTANAGSTRQLQSFTNMSTREPTDRPRVAPLTGSAVIAPTSSAPGGTNSLDTVVPGVRSNCDGVTEIPHTLPPQYRVSAASPFAVGCDGVAATGTLYTNSEVEPSLAISPVDPNNLIGTWQQDRWSDGGSHGIMTGVSQDGGVTWSLHPMPFSRCGGGASVGADYARATDPWVTFSPDGTAHMFALAFNGGTFKFGSSSAMLVSRSINGGTAWSNPIELIHDGVQFFNDKNAITADPTDSNYVYAVWDRLVSTGGGPTYFARTTNGGVTWEAARPIYDPGPSSQTIGNVIAVRSDGLVIDLFTELDEAPDHSTSGFIGVIRSSDKGVTWSAPTNVAALLAIGVTDPETGQSIRDGSLIPQIAIAPNGTIYVVWQDARFSGGVRDGIAMSHSTDGGVTWSTPVRINRKLSVQAFQPNVHVRADGAIAVSYFDLSSNTSDTTTLLTDYWLAQSSDGAIWRWDRISPAFNLDIAPDAEGLFVGDYQGFVSKGTQFVPFFVRTNAGDLANRTDVFSAPAAAIPSGAPPVDDIAESIKIAMAPQPQPISAAFRQRVHENIVRNAEGLPGWRNGVRRVPGAPPPDIDRHWRGPR